MDFRSIITNILLSRWYWKFSTLNTPANVAAIDINVALSELWGMDKWHTPAVHSWPWYPVECTPSRALMLKSPTPVLIGETIDIPQPVKEHPPRLQMRLVGQALLFALKDAPEFHLSLTDGQLVRAEGTTILVTATTDSEDVIAVPWDVGEHWHAVLKRIVWTRNFYNTPLYAVLQKQLMKQTRPLLPPPQAVVSVVGQYGIQRPWASHFGCGGQAPVVVCVGQQTISFVIDHRLVDAAACGRLYQRFLEAVHTGGH